jgi:hypothetical protein
MLVYPIICLLFDDTATSVALFVAALLHASVLLIAWSAVIVLARASRLAPESQL